MFYGTGSYGFYGYAFADLGEKFDFVYTYVPFPRSCLHINRSLLREDSADGC